MALYSNANAGTKAVPIPQITLGKTNLKVPIIGLGTGPGGMGLNDGKAEALYHSAIDAGVTFLDTAPVYGRAHQQLANVLRERRSEVTVATKCGAHSGQRFLDILEDCLQALQVEQVDVAYIHSIGDIEPENVYRKGGVLEGLYEARNRGWTRFVGFTAHNRPQRSVQALQEGQFDIIMVPVNFADYHIYGFERDVIPFAAASDVGIIAMKVFGGAPHMDYSSPTPSFMGVSGEYDHELALRYSLSIPGVDMAVIGMYNAEELAANIAWIQRNRPLTETEQTRLLSQGEALARQWGAHYGPVE